MSKTLEQDLSGVPETLLITLYMRAMETQRPDALIRDEKAELAFDAYSPIHVWRHNLQMSASKIKFRTHWGIWHGQEIEGWGDGIRLLDEWGFFDCPDSRLDFIRWLRPVEKLARTFRIYHFQLAKATG